MSTLRHRSLLGFARRLVLVTLVPAVAAAGELHTPAAAARLDDVVVATQHDVTTIRLKTSGRPQYQADFLDSPPRVVVDLEETVFAWRPPRLDAAAPLLRQVRGSQFKQNVARVVVELTRPIGYAVRQDADGIAIVISTTWSSAAPVAAPALETAPAAADRGSAAGARESIRLAQARPAQRPPAAPAPPAPAAPSNRLISLDFKDADVVNLLRILAAESGKNIVISDDVKGKMSITLKNVPWEQALDIIMEARGLVKVERGNVIRILTKDQLARERDAAAKMEEARIKAEEAKTKAEVEVRQKKAEAFVKEQEAEQKRFALEQQLAELRARGPLKEETIRLNYADPDVVVASLLGILGLTGAAPTNIPPPPSALPPGMLAIPTIGSAPLPSQAEPQPAPEVLAKGITIKAYKPTNSVFIRHYEKDLERIKKLIRESLDVPLPLIKIEGRVTEMSRTTSVEIGVQWGGAGAQQNAHTILVGQGNLNQSASGTAVDAPGRSGIGILPFHNFVPNAASLPLGSLLPISSATGLPFGGNIVNLPASGPAGGINFGIIGTRFNLNMALSALEKESKIRILHRPEIVTLDNTKASITVGTEIPFLTGSANAGFSVAFKDASVKLDVTPTVIREVDVTKIKMKILIEDNSKGADVESGQSGGKLPSITKRTATTEVVVKEGETLVVGGVGLRTESESVSKVPLFGDVPVLGWLFKRRSRSLDPNSELAVFVTPTVLRDVPKGTGPTAPPSR